MGGKKYKVICQGGIAPGADIEDVKKKMAALFKTDTSRVGALLQQKGVIIKRDIDLETAKKYAAAIKRTGARCVIDPPEDSLQPVQVTGQSPLKEEAPPTEPQVVVVQLHQKGEERFSPEPLEKLGGATEGLIISNGNPREIAYDRITAIAAYAESEVEKSGSDKNHLLIFLDSSERPFACDIEKITYSDFPVKVLPNSLASFRGFLYFLCRQNPAIILEETTFDILSGSTPKKMDPDTVLKLATAMGHLIASGNVSSQT